MSSGCVFDLPHLEATLDLLFLPFVAGYAARCKYVLDFRLPGWIFRMENTI